MSAGRVAGRLRGLRLEGLGFRGFKGLGVERFKGLGFMGLGVQEFRI